MDAALVILDGWGLGAGDPAGGAGGRDAVAAADTPTVDRLRADGAFATLRTHGDTVGLPDDQMGNSEVGHLTIGAGRVVDQESARIQRAVDEGRLGEVDAIAAAFDRAAGGRLHLLGLVSDGGVHAHQAHLHALIRAAADRDVDAVTHAVTDGRDTAPTGGHEFLAELAAVVDDAGTGHVATVSGRYYAMDRDENWERTRRAYDAIVEREADYRATSAVEAVESAYERGETDEFVTPTLIEGREWEGAANRPPLRDGDAVIVVNYRADRARQLTRMLADIEPVWDPPTSPPDVHLATMTEYDADFDLPVAFEPYAPGMTLGAAVAEAGLTQYRTAESEKYAHVTYFLNGGHEVKFAGERREIVPSPDVPTYDEYPEMSAATVTERAVATIADDPSDLLVLNYANPDMVGHTGDFDAAVAACEAVDRYLGDLETAVRATDGHLLVTADHGNADDMGTPDDPHTAHTTNPVPAIYVGPDGAGDWSLREGGTLADVAPTLLALLDIEVPGEMTGRALFE